jgi:predicted GNAT family acetyltransferase
MSLRRFEDARAFLAASIPLLAGDQARIAWLRAWVEGRKHVAEERSFMVTWVANGSTGVASQYGDAPLIVGDSAPEATEAFADALASEHPELRGVVGSAEACEAFARRWQALTGRPHALRHRMRNHVLDRLVLPAAVAGAVRVADGADREWLLAMHGAFAEEARVSWTPQSAQRTIDERLEAGLFRIWNDAEDVAFAGFTYAGSEAARVAPVYTLPDFRRRGYGAALVGAICADFLASGHRVFLVTDVTNPTSNQLYARLGFRPLDEFCELDFVGRN